MRTGSTPDDLEHDADAVAERPARRPGVLAEHGDVAGRAPAVALEDLDRGRLAGAVLAEQAVHLAGLDRERDAVDRARRPVVLHQIADGDDGHGVQDVRRPWRKPGDVMGRPVLLRMCSALGMK